MSIIEKIMHFFSAISLENAAIILFLVAYLSEYLAAKTRNIFIHARKETMQNIFIGSIAISTDILFSLCSLPWLNLLYSHFQLFNFDNNQPIYLLLLFILVDLEEYFFHYLCHKVNLLWAAHLVHHQGKQFNLSVGFRTSFFIPFFNIILYSILPILGFSPQIVLVILFMQGMYQMCIHTTLIGKLGILEHILITPSAHRVHHGCNEKYIDRNFGKVFVFWDKIFKTYEPESEAIIYGIKNEKSEKGVTKVIVKPFLNLYSKSRKRETPLREILFGKPNN